MLQFAALPSGWKVGTHVALLWTSKGNWIILLVRSSAPPISHSQYGSTEFVPNPVPAPPAKLLMHAYHSESDLLLQSQKTQQQKKPLPPSKSGNINSSNNRRRQFLINESSVSSSSSGTESSSDSEDQSDEESRRKRKRRKKKLAAKSKRQYQVLNKKLTCLGER